MPLFLIIEYDLLYSNISLTQHGLRPCTVKKTTKRNLDLRQQCMKYQSRKDAQLIIKQMYTYFLAHTQKLYRNILAANRCNENRIKGMKLITILCKMRLVSQVKNEKNSATKKYFCCHEYCTNFYKNQPSSLPFILSINKMS